MSNLFLQGTQPALAFETITISSTALPLTAATYETFESTNQTRKQAKLATITVESNSIRVRFDGTAPTASVGHVIAAGSSVELQSISQIRNFKAIAVTSDAPISVTYWGS